MRFHWLFTVLSIIINSCWSIGIDDVHMLRALELAELGVGFTSPNPCVGCVIVNEKTGTVVGEGWHAKAGQAHAEVRALEKAGENAMGCTAYVSLEPCNHFGRTPPCTHALIKAGITRVVAGMVDPDPRVSGKGLDYLKEKGVKVVTKVQESKCLEINRPFIFRVLNKRSYVTCWLPNKVENRRLSSILKAVPMASPETDMVVLGEDQVKQIMAELGGDKNVAVADLILTLPARLTVTIAPLKTGSEGDLVGFVEHYRDRTRESRKEAPRVLHLTREKCPSMRSVLETCLNEGSNAALVIAESPGDVEKWCLEGHCQHLKMDFDLTVDQALDSSAGRDGERKRILEVSSRFAEFRKNLRTLSCRPSCDLVSRQPQRDAQPLDGSAAEEEEEEGEEVREEEEVGMRINRRMLVFGAHVWRV